MTRTRWVVVMVLGVALIVVGVLWIVYSVTHTGQYDATTGSYVSDSVWPIVAYFVAFIGATLVSVGSLGFMFSWFSGYGVDDMRTSQSETLARAVPTTRVGWGDAAEADGP